MQFGFLFFLALIGITFSYKAIVFTFHDTGSHQSSISKLFLRLAQDGHEITVFDTTSKAIPDYGPRIKVIDARTSFIPALKYNVSQKVWKSFPDFTSIVRLYYVGDEYLESLVTEKPQLIADIFREKYDVVILGDIFSTHGIWFTQKLKETQNIPYILYGTTLQFHALNTARGFGRHFYSRPSVDGDLRKKGKEIFNLQSFWIRFETFRSAFSELVSISIAVDYVVPTFEKLNVLDFNYQNFQKDGAFVMSETFDRLGLPLAEASDFKGVGPHCPKVGKLSRELEAFVNDPLSKGTIFVALGSHANWSVAPEYIAAAFFAAFESLSEYRFIFSYNGKPRKVGKHIKLLTWSPQKEILNHPNTKMFISHSGLKSTMEAICAATPVIFMPIYAEQRANSQYMTYFEYAQTLDKFTVTATDVVEAIQNIEKNFAERKQRMIKLKDIYLDRIINPMDEAAFYVSRVVKTRGGKTSRLPFPRASIIQNWFVFLSGDLILFVLALIVILSK